MGKKFRNKDLAARLGVSGTLVSLVLNNKADQHGIRKDTQEKVLALARQMGYFETLQVKEEISPVEQTPGIIGMVVPSMNDPLVIQITPLLQKIFLNIGLGFSVVTRDTDDQRYDRMAGAFRKFFSGMLLVGETADDNTIRTLKNADYPFVLLEKQSKTGRHNTICTDLSAGAQIVADHIGKLGYSNIVIIADSKLYKADREPVGILTDALAAKSGINRPVIFETDRNMLESELDFNRIDQFLRPPYRADALIVMNAGLVFPLMNILRKKNLRIPVDIAIISMEEGEGFDLLYSPVTCLRKPLPALSAKAANMIWGEIRNAGKGKFKRQISLQPELVIRSSCGKK